MDKDKAIRSAKLTAAGVLDKRRAATAVNRAGGQIAPSKYLPDVPRQVHAAGGSVDDLPFVGRNRNGVPEDDAVASPIQKAEYPYMSMVPAKHVYSEPLIQAINKAHANAQEVDVPIDQIRTDVSAIWRERVRNPAGGLPFIEKIGGVHHLRDGNHRVAAAMLRGDKTVRALVADMDDAIKASGRATGGRANYDAGGYVPRGWGQLQQLPAAQLPVQSQRASPVEQLASIADAYGSLKDGKPDPAEDARNSISPTVAAHMDANAAPPSNPAAAPAVNYNGVSDNARAAMEALQAGWGGKDFNVISSYRDPEKNKAVNGAKKSQHLHGNAFDVDTTGWTPEQKLALATQAYNSGFRGFGFYNNNLHFDVGDPRAWGPDYHDTSLPDWASPWVEQYLRAGRADGGKVLPSGYRIHIPPGKLGVLAKYKGKNVGQMTLQRDSDTGDLTAFEMGVHPDHQRKGLMSAMHDAAEEAFGPIKPDKTLTDQGFAFWKGYRPDAVSDNLRFHSDKLIGKTANTPYGQGIIKSVGKTGMNTDLTGPDYEGKTGWASIHDNEDMLRDAGVDTSTLKYADGGAVTDSDEFRNWFGDSVTHTNGEPHVFYTGTSKDKDFTSHNVGRHGAWFTRDPDVASQYAEQNDSQGHKRDGWNMVKTNTASRVIPAYVKAENPYTGDLPPEAMGDNYKALQSNWFDTLRARGHDAWIPSSQEGNLVVALKEPQQIKSIFNNGKFDPKQKHMNKADGGPVDDQASPNDFATRPQAGELPNAGGLRGGAGVLQAQNEASLEGLPSKVRIPLTGETITASADPRIRQIARDYMAGAGLPYSPPTKYARVDPKRAARVAAAYDAMQDNADDPLTKASYDAMIRETMAQYKAAKDAGFKAEFWHPDKQEDPYGASPRLATEDIRKNHHMWVYPTHAGYGSGDPISEEDIRKNPMLRLTGETWNGIPVTVNDVFRAVHDYYGHAKEGLGFRHDGEENAWRAHASMFSPLARLAMTTETRGQNSWLNFGPHGDKNRTARTEDTVFAPQKVGILPHWVHHEGAEDFMPPEDIASMRKVRENYNPVVSKAMRITRRFTKDGSGATMALKSKEN